MKKFILIVLTLFTFSTYSQVNNHPNSFYFQVAFTNPGTYDIKISIITDISGSVTNDYIETHFNLTTSSDNTIELNIGEGTPTSGYDFRKVKWFTGKKLIKVEYKLHNSSLPFQSNTPNIQILTVPYALQSKYLANSLSIEQFGGYPNDNLDDAPALQAMLDYAQLNNFSKVYIPKGEYTLNTTVVFKFRKPIIIEGEQLADESPTYSSRFRWNGPNQGIMFDFQNYINGNAYKPLVDVTLKGIYLDGRNQNGTFALYGIQAKDLHRLFIEKCRIVGCYTGVLFEDCWGSLIRESIVDHNKHDGIYLKKNNNNFVVESCVVNANGDYTLSENANLRINGTSLDGSALNVNILKCDFEVAGSNNSPGPNYVGQQTLNNYGLVVQNATAVNIIGCYFERSRYNLYCGTGAEVVNLEGCYIQDGEVFFDGTNYAVIKGNIFNHPDLDASFSPYCKIRIESTKNNPEIFYKSNKLSFGTQTSTYQKVGSYW